MCMQDFKRCSVESASPVRESSPQNTLGQYIPVQISKTIDLFM